MVQTNFIVRLGVKDANVVKGALKGLGAEGQAALRKIERAGKPASKGLLAVSRASGELQGSLHGMAGRAGLLGSALSALGPAGLAAAAGIGAAVAGIAGAMRRARTAIDELDKLDDTALKLGVNVEALQELRFAAEQTGVPVQTLDMALQRFTRRAAEAAVGTGEAKAALREMGIALVDQSGNIRSTEDLLADVADAFARIEDPATRVRLAFKLFDSEGVALVNTLAGGSAALDELRQRARDMGVVFDEQVVKNASAAKDEIAALEKSTGAYLDLLALQMEPTLVDVTRAWNTFIKSITESITAMGDARQELSNLLSDADRESMAAAGFPLPPPTAGRSVDIPVPPPLERPSATGGGTVAGRTSGTASARSARGTPAGAAFGSFRAAQEHAGAEGQALAERMERDFAEARRALERIRDANLRATGDIIAQIELRRTRELETLDEIAATEAEKAEARRQINETASLEIIDANRRIAEESRRAAEESTRGFREFGSTVTRVFADMLVSGEFTAQGLIDAFARIAVDRTIQQVVGAGGSLFGSLFAGGGAGSSGFAGALGSPRAAGVRHRGGVVGFDAAPSRMLPAAVFDTAPRLHGGGLLPGEVPAVLERGEMVLTRGQQAALARPIQVVVNNNNGSQVSTRETERGPVIDIDEIVATTVARHGSRANRAVAAQIQNARRVR